MVVLEDSENGNFFSQRRSDRIGVVAPHAKQNHQTRINPSGNAAFSGHLRAAHSLHHRPHRWTWLPRTIPPHHDVTHDAYSAGGTGFAGFRGSRSGRCATLYANTANTCAPSVRSSHLTRSRVSACEWCVLS